MVKIKTLSFYDTIGPSTRRPTLKVASRSICESKPSIDTLKHTQKVIKTSTAV